MVILELIVLQNTPVMALTHRVSPNGIVCKMQRLYAPRRNKLLTVTYSLITVNSRHAMTGSGGVPRRNRPATHQLLTETYSLITPVRPAPSCAATAISAEFFVNRSNFAP